ncbi:hypothetical protein BpHYR1_011832 [Brachionus plicatilis]|uniref:Uncharacterized protein n=1 Tax=Brachionus plicatilis TaxID=10195 RepID=A0A3M7RVZ9_BRAPC|nr:hypothetical protein BpHYR1_011832 [Brachionus plicatilis]
MDFEIFNKIFGFIFLHVRFVLSLIKNEIKNCFKHLISEKLRQSVFDRVSELFTDQLTFIFPVVKLEKY